MKQIAVVMVRDSFFVKYHSVSFRAKVRLFWLFLGIKTMHKVIVVLDGYPQEEMQVELQVFFAQYLHRADREKVQIAERSVHDTTFIYELFKIAGSSEKDYSLRVFTPGGNRKSTAERILAQWHTAHAAGNHLPLLLEP